MENQTKTRFSFGEFEVDASRRLLTKRGETVNLNPKALDLLVALVENRGRVVSKNELLDAVWKNQFVEENNLTVHIAALRKALGERKNDHRFIVTVPGKGYKFVAVEAANGERNFEPIEPPEEIIIENRSISRILIEEEIESEPEQTKSANSVLEEKRQSHLPLPIYVFPAIALAALVGIFAYWFWGDGTSANSFQYNFSKLTTSGKVTSAALTPDAKYAVFAQIETDGESLWLRHIPTGSQQQLLPTKPVRYVGLAVSPEGNQIYATIFSPELSDPQIWRVPLLGGAIEEIKGITTGSAVTFSPDGKQMAFVESRSSTNENHLLISDANGADKKILMRAKGDVRSLANFNANPVAWSPDGAEIACAVDEKTASGAAKAGIVLINPATGGERFISEKRWDFIENISWIDAESLAFIAYTSDSWQGQIWTISRKSGDARQITNDLNSYSWLASAGGNLLTVQKNAVSYISTGDFEENGDRIEPREIFKESGYIDNVVWSSGKAILYSSSRNGKREIWRVNSDGTNPVQLTVNANVAFGISVSPVDNSIIFGSTENNNYFLKLVGADGKNMRALTEGPEDVYPNFAADGETVIFQRGLKNKLTTLWRVSLSGGKPVQITDTHGTHPSVSPDGWQTAQYFMDAEIDNLWRIRLVSNADGAVLNKLSLPQRVTERRMRWHPSGRFIGQIFYEGENIKLLLLPVDGGASKVVSGLGKGDVNWFDWSPDGRQIAVSHTIETQDVVFLSP